MKRCLVLMLCGVMVAGLVPTVSAATMTWLGVSQLSTGDVENAGAWRSNAGDPKPAAFDPNSDKAYGSDGYVASFFSAPHGDDYAPIVSSLPSYISNVTFDTTNKGSLWAYSIPYISLDDPSLPIGSTTNMGPTANFVSYLGSSDKFFTITLAQNANFLLTVIMGGRGDYRTINATEIKLISGATVATSTGLTGDSWLPEYGFFQIQGNAGDVIEVWLKGPAGGYAATSGLGFEAIPEPATLGLLISGLGLLLSKRRIG